LVGLGPTSLARPDSAQDPSPTRSCPSLCSLSPRRTPERPLWHRCITAVFPAAESLSGAGGMRLSFASSWSTSPSDLIWFSWSLAFVLVLGTLDTNGCFGRRQRISAALRAGAAPCHFLVPLHCRCCSPVHPLPYHVISIDAGRTAAQDCNLGVVSNLPTRGAAAIVA
jgi:hypothetical protein